MKKTCEFLYPEPNCSSAWRSETAVSLACSRESAFSRAAAMRNKKAQGLGFVAVIIMLALLYFIFRYNTQAFEFTMQVGDERAHLVTSFTEAEKAKAFAASALRQAVYAEMKEKGVGADCSNFQCPDQNNVKTIFNNYSSLYAPSSELLDVNFPDYFIKLTCGQNTVTAEAFGFKEGCFLKSSFLYPKIPCEDIEKEEACEKAVFTDGSAGACQWDRTKTPSCNDARLEPECSLKEQSSCSGDCEWKTSYDEDINVVSVPLLEYQFSTDSDAHILETISCPDYTKFNA